MDFKVLVVEDSPDLIQLWKVHFFKAGIKANFELNGHDALLRVGTGYEPDVLMTDFILPDMSGAELIERLQKRLPTLKPVVVTGKDPKEIKDQLPRNTEVLRKPVDFNFLVSVLKSL